MREHCDQYFYLGIVFIQQTVVSKAPVEHTEHKSSLRAHRTQKLLTSTPNTKAPYEHTEHKSSLRAHRTQKLLTSTPNTKAPYKHTEHKSSLRAHRTQKNKQLKLLIFLSVSYGAPFIIQKTCLHVEHLLWM